MGCPCALLRFSWTQCSLVWRGCQALWLTWTRGFSSRLSTDALGTLQLSSLRISPLPTRAQWSSSWQSLRQARFRTARVASKSAPLWGYSRSLRPISVTLLRPSGTPRTTALCSCSQVLAVQLPCSPLQTLPAPSCRLHPASGECPSVFSVNNPYRRVSPSYACRASMLPTSIALVVRMMLRRAPFAPRVWRSPASGTQQASRG